MKKLFYLFLFTGLMSLVMSGCYPDDSLIVEDLDLAITHYDSEQDFSKLSTFYMYDTVVYIGEDTIGNSSIDDHILAQLSQNLVSSGWTEITDTTNNRDNIDVVIFASILTTDITTYYYNWYDYYYWYPWGWYYPYYDPYYSYYYYPYYGSGYSSYSYSIGTVLCEMINVGDLNARDPHGENIGINVPIIWTGAINGVISGSNSSIQGRITKQMRQLFDQSPYLKQ
jgi:Domain of unknown function (DUF4136)